MADLQKKSSIITRALHGTDNFFNKLIVFISGLFVSAIFFLILLKLLNAWGIYLGLGLSAAINLKLKQKHRARPYLNTFNNALITFNIITIILLISLVIGFGAIQNILR